MTVNANAAGRNNRAAFEFEAAEGLEKLRDLEHHIAEAFYETPVGEVAHAAPRRRSICAWR